ncbi:hypothetical protein KCP74_16810 [Salmonella enterica subsp. enterica]|nr:hypothetical protein KCP74_16810 [Salmonella enterica subsp. enterica]
MFTILNLRRAAPEAVNCANSVTGVITAFYSSLDAPCRCVSTYGGDSILSKQYIAAYPEECSMNNQPLQAFQSDQPRSFLDKTPGRRRLKNPKKTKVVL